MRSIYRLRPFRLSAGLDCPVALDPILGVTGRLRADCRTQIYSEFANIFLLWLIPCIKCA
jgi:hypothetical protein